MLYNDFTLVNEGGCIVMTDAEMLEVFLGGAAGLVIGIYIFMLLAMIGVLVFYIICSFKVFGKLGLPGWYCLIPFYGSYKQTQKIYGEGWWFLCGMIPYVGWAYQIKFMMDMARCFGFEWWFGLVMSFLPIVGEPVLAFDKNHQYVGMHIGGPLTW